MRFDCSLLASRLAFMESIKIVFGKRLKAELDKRDWSQSYFADRVETTRSNVTLWIKGKSSPTLEMLSRVAKELNLSPHELIAPLDTEAKDQPIILDDALLTLIEHLGFERPKRLKKRSE